MLMNFTMVYTGQLWISTVLVTSKILIQTPIYIIIRQERKGSGNSIIENKMMDHKTGQMVAFFIHLTPTLKL